MAKRIAEKELTDRNWDQEDEAEEVKYTLNSPLTPAGSGVLICMCYLSCGCNLQYNWLKV